ncbi:MAG: hypothetical protein EPN56_11950 [Rhodanobacter sp.]|nr:MAG: hypothetical protein EPN66_09305 [Rhodanobacter sp.]TAM34886.1 MAG: hypothetical protein EPN56_11950 [Rhodanobacter sp.]
MATGDPLAEDEEVVRAYMHPYWDDNVKRATRSAFTDTNVSVSRLAICDINKIVAIFKKDFEGRHDIKAIGCAKVAAIIQAAEEPADGKKPPVILRVVEDPIKGDPRATDNPAHALICGRDRNSPNQPKKITGGVANRLLRLFKLVAFPE